MKSKILLALAIFAGLSIFAFLDAKTTTSDDSKQAAVDKAVGTLISFGSAEAAYKAQYGTYATLQEMLDLKYLNPDQFKMKDATSATLNSYNLSVVPSPDGLHFQISMIAETICDGSLFLNDSYVIFKGVPIGSCSEPKN